jgi:oligopeptide transport system ATP-binding protein
MKYGGCRPPPREALVEVQDLRTHYPLVRGFPIRRRVGVVRAVDGVDLTISVGETLGLSILYLERPTSGRVLVEGIDLSSLSWQQIRRMRRRMQIIFQDPYSSLDPRMRIAQIVGEPLRAHRIGTAREQEERVVELLDLVGLSSAFLDRYPHEFSGGQRQRIGIARALALSPAFIVCDEPISALDVSIQAQIVNLLHGLQRQLGLTYLFIAHDLSMVRHISDRVAVMYLGKIVELTDSESIYSNPLHPYTQALISAIPIPDPFVEQSRDVTVLRGEIPSPFDPPQGCRFHTRCPIAIDQCSRDAPELRRVANEHWVSCLLVESRRQTASVERSSEPSSAGRERQETEGE